MKCEINYIAFGISNDDNETYIADFVMYPELNNTQFYLGQFRRFDHEANVKEIIETMCDYSKSLNCEKITSNYFDGLLDSGFTKNSINGMYERKL